MLKLTKAQTAQNKSKITSMALINNLLSSSRIIFLLAFPALMSALNFPLELHGQAFFGKYLNSDTSIYYLDVSTDFYCTIMEHGSLSAYLRYRNDLDVAGFPQSGVVFDPWRVHYYIVTGFDYLFNNLDINLYFMHDCLHQLDTYMENAPIFNRFRLSVGDADYHYSRELHSLKRFLWRLTLGYYPGWQYHNWDINAGADYKYDLISEVKFSLLRKNQFATNIGTALNFTKAESNMYQQHLVTADIHYLSALKNAFGVRLAYNIKNDDPIKNPDRLWLLSTYFQF